MHAYDQLRTLALRSEVMTKAGQLKPSDVVRWAQKVKLTTIPPALVKLLGIDDIEGSASVSTAPPSPAHEDPSAANEGKGSTLQKKAMVQKYREVWPSIEADLNHANKNGLREAGKTDPTRLLERSGSTSLGRTQRQAVRSA